MDNSVKYNIFFRFINMHGTLCEDVVSGEGMQTKAGAINRLRRKVQFRGDMALTSTLTDYVKAHKLKYVIYTFDEHDKYNKEKCKVIERHGDIKHYFDY